MLDQPAVVLDPEHGTRLAGHHEEPTVGQPTQAGRLPGYLDLDPHVPRHPRGPNRTVVEVGVPQASFMPSRALAEVEPFDEGQRFLCRHVGHAILRASVEFSKAT